VRNEHSPISRLYCISALTCMGLCLLSAQAHAAPPRNLYIYPYLQHVTPSAITIMWETDVPVVGHVSFHPQGRAGRVKTVSEKRAKKIHEIRLTGLASNSTYRYRVDYGRVRLQSATFTTAPPLGTSDWNIVVYGDNRSHPKRHRAIVRQIRALQPRLVINTGDLVNRGTNYSEWKQQFFDPIRGLAEFIPFFTCLGNHEQNAKHYYRYMALPDENGEVYYSFRYANALFIALNSNPADAPFHAGSPQTLWLEETLKKNRDATWRVVYLHHPMYRAHLTRGAPPHRWVWQPIVERYGVDLVITGHDHHYLRTFPIRSHDKLKRPGVVHVTSGGGGAGLYKTTPRVYLAARRQIHHVVSLSAKGNTLTGRAVDIDGNVFDTFSIKKGATYTHDNVVSHDMFQIARGLKQSIAQTPLAPLDAGPTVIKRSISAANPFAVPMQLTWRWQLEQPWTATTPAATMRLEPNTPITIPIELQTTGPKAYPVPTLEVTVNSLDGRQMFRNNTLDIKPVKISRNGPIIVRRGRRAPRIDGSLTDTAWRRAKRYSGFVTVQNDQRAKRDAQVRFLHRRGTLYVGVRVDAAKTAVGAGSRRQDSHHLPYTEHVRVHIGVGDQAYTFLTTSRGTLMDAKGRRRKWDGRFRAAVRPTSTGWQAEFAIPLRQFPQYRAGRRAIRINVGRRDLMGGQDTELFPSFGLSRREVSIPTFTGEWSDPSHFARAVLDQR
jgi:hypothetical protein